MAITTLKTPVALADLTHIGSVTVLGSTVVEGDVQAYVKGTFGAPTDAISAGYFGTNKGKFRMVYPFNEQATVVVGEISLTDESTGVVTHYSAGDSWVVTKGTPVLWDVRSDNFVKHYLGAA